MVERSSEISEVLLCAINDKINETRTKKLHTLSGPERISQKVKLKAIRKTKEKPEVLCVAQQNKEHKDSVRNKL